MAKADRFYFDNFVEAADCACKAADYLAACLHDYNPDNMQEMLRTLHSYEHEGDKKKHEMSAALARAFVTPVDREDLALISQCIDDVSDSIEEVLQAFYMYRITRVMPAAAAFADRIAQCCGFMKEMLAEFVHFKKPAALHERIVQINHVEEECDKFYAESMYHIPDFTDDVLETVSWRHILSMMENCTDACEHVGDSVGTVVMKNT